MKKIALMALLFPMLGNAATFTCGAIQDGQIDSGSARTSAKIIIKVDDKKMNMNIGGQSWRLGLIGQKSIAKMYATPDQSIGATYIDNGKDAVFVTHAYETDGTEHINTISMCSED